MNLLLLNASAGRARRVREGGRDYLVAPLTSIVPGVLSGSKGPLYYPEDEVSRNVGDWDGMPLTVYHPFDPATGAHLSASEPGVVERQGVGEVRKSTYNGKLRHEGWFDAERTRAVYPRVYQSLVSGKPIELSTGLYTDNEVAPQGSHHNGRPYGHVARNYRPDHIAVLPDQQGACSVADGCGVMVNRLNTNANPEGHNQYTTGHPSIDRAVNSAKNHADKAVALHESAKHFADIQLGGHGLAREHIKKAAETVLGSGSASDMKEAAKAVGALNPRGGRDKLLADVTERITDRTAGALRVLGGTDDPKKVKTQAQKRLKDAGFRPVTNAEDTVPQSTLEKFIGWLVGNAPSAGHPQVRGVGGKFGNGPDLDALKRAVDASAQGKGPDGKGNGPPLGPEDMEEGEEDDIKAQHGKGDEKSKAILAPDDSKGTKNANPEGHNQYTSGGGGSEELDKVGLLRAESAIRVGASKSSQSKKALAASGKADEMPYGHDVASEQHAKAAQYHETMGNDKVAAAHRALSEHHKAKSKNATENEGTESMAGNMIPQGGTAPVAAPEPDAQAASRDAAVASMDHRPARDHAMKAMDFGNGGKPNLAAGRHDKAAEEHDDAATESRKAGDEYGAQDHEHAAMLHRKASSMHSLAVRNAKKQQGKTQDGDDNEPDNDEDDVENNLTGNEFASDDQRKAFFGKIAGDSGPSGKAGAASKEAISSGTKEAHSKAAKLHKAAAAHHNAEGNEDKAELHSAAAKFHSRKGTKGGGTENMDRTETIDHLTTNCPCWKGGNDVLNLMSDRQLASVARNAKAEGSNADTTGTGGTVQAGGEEDEDDHETADDHTSEDLFTDKVKVKKDKMSENRFLNSLPPSYREAVVNAQEITRRERVKLVNRLITNVNGDAARRRIGARLMQKPLAELRDMLAMVPEPAYNTGGGDADNVPLYNGAGYGADDDTRNRGVSDDDILPLPVTNFADIAKEQRRQRQQV